MSRFELTIDPDYVPHWTIQDGLREFLQNALDESTLEPSNSMEVRREGNTLFISTKNAKLTKKTLLIGSSSKRSEENTIGQEGEGYKLACLVLARAGKKVIIHNYSEKEKWTPKIIKSRRFGTKLLVIDTEKFRWTSPPNHDLTFEIKGITDVIYKEMVSRSLFLRESELSTLEYHDTKGIILLDEEEKGRVYVNGLYISTVKEMEYGYNFKPREIELDRDRRAVTDFNLTWQTSDLWCNFTEEEAFKNMLKRGAKDVQYINSHYYNKDEIYKDFEEDHGDMAYPVSDQHNYDLVKSMYKGVTPIIVDQVHCESIKNSTNFTNKRNSFELKKKDETPTELLTKFKSNHFHSLTNKMEEDLSALIKLSKDWR